MKKFRIGYLAMGESGYLRINQHHLTSYDNESPDAIRMRLMNDGFVLEDGTWITPSAIMSVIGGV